MSESGSKRRDRAAAAREAAQADERRRERLVRIIGAVVVVVVVVGIIAVAVIARGNSSSAPVAEIDPGAALPAGVLAADSTHPFGVTYGTAAEGAPVLEIWEDFQCPACGAVEQANGEGIAALAESGEVQLIWRPATFLDRVNEGGDPSVQASSSRAAAAWGCAIDAGKTREYHDALYANQPAGEGEGWTDEQLLGLAEQAGIAGAELETFTSCVADGTYRGWATNSGIAFGDSGADGTPYGLLDGVPVPTPTLADDALLREFIASGGTASTPAPEETP